MRRKRRAVGRMVLFLCTSMLASVVSAAGTILPLEASEQHFQSLGRGQTPFDAAIAGNGQVVVVGRAGLLAVLDSNGVDAARRVRVGSTTNFLSIALGSDGLLRAADGEGTIWRINATLDQVVVEEKTGAGSLFGLQYFSDGSGVAVGEFGTVLVKHSADSMWQRLEVEWSLRLPELITQVGDVAPHIYRVCARADGGFFAVGEYGLVVTYGAGQMDVRRVARDTGNLFACATDSHGREVVGGRAGKFFFRDTPFGPWLLGESSVDSDIYDITVVGSEFFAAGAGGMLLKSTDGRRWVALESLPLKKTGWLMRVLVSGRYLFLFGENGYTQIDKLGMVVSDSDRHFDRLTTQAGQAAFQ